MLWFWLNVPLAVAFIGAWCGIPLAKVLRNPDWGPERAGSHCVQPGRTGAGRRRCPQRAPGGCTGIGGYAALAGR